MAYSDRLGDWLKALEAQETSRRLIPTLPVYARIDGRSFSKFTRGMERPFDPRLIEVMVETTKTLVEKTHAVIGYTQSDEISLAWHAPDPKSSILFEGKITKMTSVLAGLATAAFHRALSSCPDDAFRAYADRMPHFDARLIAMPSREEVANMFLWRNLDATKNAVSMAARSYFSHRSLHKVSGAAMQERLFQEAGINFNDYPEAFKRGTFVARRQIERRLDEAERVRIPESRRPPPEATFIRNRTCVLSMPPLSRVTNRVGVIFDGEDPVLQAEQNDFTEQAVA